MKTDDKGVTDLTQEAGLEESNDSELFANLSSRAPTASGLHRRPRETLAQVARLGALVPSTAPGRSVPPPPSGSVAPPIPPSAPPRSLPPRPPSAAPVVKPAVSTIQTGAFEDDEPTPGRRVVPQRPSALSSKAKLAIGVAGAALILAVLAVVAMRPTAQSGSLIVTATGPGSSEVTGIEVLVNGEKRCDTSPCKIATIASGTHLVSVRAKGFNPTAPLAVTVSGGNESALNVALAPVAAPAPAAPNAAAAQPAKPASPAPEPAAAGKVVEARPATTTSPTRAALPVAAAQPSKSEPSTAGAAAPGTTPATADKDAFSTLRIVSLPVASVLLDGRPIGRTPQVVRVSPGQHRVAIVAGEDRRAQTVTVAPGATQVVSVRF
jgi:hypothetical protein